jgi:hypothetical protein
VNGVFVSHQSGAAILASLDDEEAQRCEEQEQEPLPLLRLHPQLGWVDRRRHAEDVEGHAVGRS